MVELSTHSVNMHQMLHITAKVLTSRLWHKGFYIGAIYPLPRASTNYIGFSISYFQMLLDVLCNECIVHMSI